MTTGVLVLSGSSGRLETGRADLLAAQGAEAVPFRWFGGPGQQPAPYLVPLEEFDAPLADLATRCDRVVVLGTSFGAEAALLLGADPRVHAVVAVAPSLVVWAGVTPDGRQVSHWTRAGRPLPFVPFVEDWHPRSDPPAFRSYYATSLAAASPERLAAATIPVEAVAGEVLLIAGGDDQVWPADEWAKVIEERRRAHGLATAVVTHPGAGHRPLLPGEEPASGGVRMRRGGTSEADAELGRRAWPHLLRLLRPGR